MKRPRIKQLLLGKPRNPMSQETRKHISLIAFFAWIGLGADGLSSSSYGPEQAYIALGHHVYLAFYLAIMIAITVFIISMAYNQVIELFPSGGGGYKVASRLIGPYAGLISGVALLLGYVLTIAISFASGVDALFSLLPLGAQPYKLITESILILLLMYLNMRGMKESIKIFLPIFLGFVLTHLLIILYGVVAHGNQLGAVYHEAALQTHEVSATVGWFFVVALLLRSYSLGGGTYTGLEAVSNNVNNLAEPRIKTGKWAMFYMAVSLSFTAGGIILLYLLWHAKPVDGETLNAVVFGSILNGVPLQHLWLILLLIFEAGLLFVAANTGFLGGPAVLANMAIDYWVPKKFRNLSSRLVIQNGIVLFGMLSLLVLWVSEGSVSMLVILYSTSVFITFTMSLLGLTFYWATHRRKPKWIFRLSLSAFGFIVCLFILTTIIIAKFADGGWLTLVFNGGVFCLCLLIKRHYRRVKSQIKKLDKLFYFPIESRFKLIRELDPSLPTAVFLIGDSAGEGMHTLLSERRMWPGYFKNYVFMSVGVVDVNSYESERTLARMEKKVKNRLKYFVEYSHQIGIPAKSYCAFGIDPVKELDQLAETIQAEFSNPIFFAAKLVLMHESWLTRLLHNETPMSLQRHLLLKGMRLIILPIQLSLKNDKKEARI